MGLAISIMAIVLSLASIVVSVVIYHKGVKREQKQATLDAINVLQVQVFDNLNQYRLSDIREIADAWARLVGSRKGAEAGRVELTAEDERLIDEYKVVSGYLARIEHFALGVNTGIYDVETAERAATSYLTMLYRVKLKPIIQEKHSGPGDTEYYAEFRKLVQNMEKLEASSSRK